MEAADGKFAIFWFKCGRFIVKVVVNNQKKVIKRLWKDKILHYLGKGGDFIEGTTSLSTNLSISS